MASNYADQYVQQAIHAADRNSIPCETPPPSTAKAYRMTGVYSCVHSYPKIAVVNDKADS